MVGMYNEVDFDPTGKELRDVSSIPVSENNTSNLAFVSVYKWDTS